MSKPQSAALVGLYWWRFDDRVIAPVAVTVIAFVSFTVVVARRSASPIWVSDRNLYLQRAEVAEQIRATGHPLFLEFQDGEISFATGLASQAGFGLAADPEAAKAQRAGTYFDLLERRGITIAAASGSYPHMLAESHASKSVFSAWGFNPDEIKRYSFDPFCSDPVTGVVLYRIVPEPPVVP